MVCVLSALDSEIFFFLPVDGRNPKVLVIVDFLQLLQIHLFFDFVTNHCHHLGNPGDSCALIFGGTIGLERISGIPSDVVHFFQILELSAAGTVRIRIILGVAFATRNFLNDTEKPHSMAS